MTGEPGRPAADVPEIIRDGTRLGPVPLVPEIRLWQASEPIALWQRTEQAAALAERAPGQAAGAPGQAAGAPGQAAGAPGQAAGAPGQAAGAPGQAAGAPGQAAGTPGQAAGTPGQAAGTPGQAAGGAGQPGLDPPFWAFAWAGGQALARYLLDHPQTVRGRRVIDIASGSGLVAIAAARAGAALVTGYDIDPLAAAAIKANAAANGVTVAAVRADVLDSGSAPTPGADVVLVADAFYQRDLAARVMRFLDRARAGGAAVLAGDFGRAYLPRDRFAPVATYDVPGLRALEDSDVKRTTVWTLAGSEELCGGS